MKIADKKKPLIAFAAAAAVLTQLIASPASALDAYINFAGDSSAACPAKPGLEGFVEMTDVSHDLIARIADAEGIASRTTYHKPITLRVNADCGAMPILQQALVSEEAIPTVEIRLFDSASGSAIPTYSIKLEQASIGEIGTPVIGRDGKIQLVVSLTYRNLVESPSAVH